MRNVLPGIYYELKYERNWLPDSPRLLLLGFDSLETTGICGLAYVGGYQMGIIDTTPGMANGRCSGNGYEYAASTHELVHTFGLDHISGGGLMDPTACGGGALSSCSLEFGQAVWLINNSAWLFPRK